MIGRGVQWREGLAFTGDRWGPRRIALGGGGGVGGRGSAMALLAGESRERQQLDGWMTLPVLLVK